MEAGVSKKVHGTPGTPASSHLSRMYPASRAMTEGTGSSTTIIVLSGDVVLIIHKS